MKKFRITALLIVVCMVCTMLPLSALATDGDADKIILHVSADAKFAGDGSENAPFKTIEAAQMYLRSKDHRRKTVEVLIHGGTYNTNNKTLIFTQEDSGTEKNPVIYRSAGDGEVWITNKVKLNHMDFQPVKDKGILTRLPSHARDKVGVLSLEGYGLNAAMFDMANRFTDPREHPMYPFIYLNGKKQTVSRWPNIGYETIKTVVIAGEAVSGGSAKGTVATWNYNTLRPERWHLADQALVRGYLGSEYMMDSIPLGVIDPEEKTIAVTRTSIYGAKPGHRWFVENLVEEIDSPGEYFVDAKTMKLYYYAPYPLKETDVMEVCTFASTYISLSGASHIIFDGINVSDNVNNYAYGISSCDSITVKNATIRNIGTMGVRVYNSKNCVVQGCTIYEVGKSAVYVRGGANRDTLEPSNNLVSNCLVFNFATRYCGQDRVGISLGRTSENTSIGDTLENCIIYSQPHAYAIHYGGLEQTIRNNECFSVLQDSGDIGVIYCGRLLREWGSVIEYNYVHDFGPIFAARYQLQGIYWDDWQAGQTAFHNIIVPGSKKRTAGDLIVGYYNNFSENIVVNSDIGVRMTDRKQKIHSTAYNSTAGTGVTPAILEKYPQILELREQLDKDDMMPDVRGNIAENNLSVDVNKNQFDAKMIENGTINNNPVTDDYSVFVDAANHDYRLTMEAMEKFGFPETMINEKNFSMDQIGIQPEIMKVEKAEDPFRLLYPTNGQMDVVRNTAYIKWEEAIGADTYEYVVATDPELTNVVATGKTPYTLVELPDLKNGTVYYYKVYAKCLSKQIGNTWGSVGVPYMFKTTDEDVLEKEFLEEEIEEIKKLRDSLEVGSQLGQYKPEALTALQSVLSNAEYIASLTTGSQAEIENTAADVKAFRESIVGYKHAGHQALKVEGGEWVASSAALTITQNEDTVKFETGGSAWAYLNEITPSHMIQHFKMKINFAGWTGISLKQNNPKATPYDSSINNYLIVIKPDLIEFQKYNPAAPKKGILSKYNNTFIKDGEWADIEFGAVDVVGGVNVFLKVNGVEVFSELDANTPNFNEGYFTVFPGSAGGVIELKQADPASVPAEEFFFKGSTEKEEEKTVYNFSNKIVTSTGTWTDADATTIDGSKVKISTEPNASAKYTVTDTNMPYKVYYYHKPFEGADKNATVTMTAYTPTIGGNVTVVKNIDLSSGKEGWVYLGTYECASHIQTGTIEVEFKGSGTGTLVAPVTGFTKTDSQTLEFSRTFYEYSNNLLLMKVDSQKAYTTFEQLAIPDAAPYIENNITMVPLRFVAEAFDATVNWNAETQKATITKDGMVVEFTLGSKAYVANGSTKETETEAKLVNGRTMVPLRATAEALGKKVMWYGEGKLILIADGFSFKEDDTTKLENAAKGFERGYN